MADIHTIPKSVFLRIRRTLFPQERNRNPLPIWDAATGVLLVYKLPEPNRFLCGHCANENADRIDAAQDRHEEYSQRGDYVQGAWNVQEVWLRSSEMTGCAWCGKDFHEIATETRAEEEFRRNSQPIA